MFGSPDDSIVALTPSAIESTATKTSTTPAMPITATADEPSRSRIDRMVTPVTAIICEIIQFLLSASTMLQAAGLEGRQRTGGEPEHQHQRDAGDDVLVGK